MNKELIKIVTFDLIDTEIFEEKIYYLPEVDAFNMGFQESRYESIFFIGNVGVILWLIYFHVVFFILHLILCKCKKLQ